MSPKNIFTLLLVTGGLIVAGRAKGDDGDRLSNLMDVLQAKFNADRNSICVSYRELEDARAQNLEFIDVGQGMGTQIHLSPAKCFSRAGLFERHLVR